METPKSATELSPKQEIAASEVYAMMQNHRFDKVGAAKTALSFSRYGNNFTRSVVYHYTNGLRGKYLRRRVLREYGIGYAGTLWAILIIIQIIYYLKKLWSEDIALGK